MRLFDSRALLHLNPRDVTVEGLSVPLIQCPDCKRKISDAAFSCPRCERPMHPPPPDQQSTHAPPERVDELQRGRAILDRNRSRGLVAAGAIVAAAGASWSGVAFAVERGLTGGIVSFVVGVLMVASGRFLAVRGEGPET